MNRADNFNKIFASSEEIPEEVLLLYVEGKLNAEQMHKVERYLLENEPASDFVEGMQLLKRIEKEEEGLMQINKFNEGLIGRGFAPKIIGINRNYFYAIAATILLLVVSGYFFTYYFNSMNEQQMAQLDTTGQKKPAFLPLEKSTNEEKPQEIVSPNFVSNEKESNGAPSNDLKRAGDIEVVPAAKQMESESETGPVKTAAEKRPVDDLSDVMEKAASAEADDASVVKTDQSNKDIPGEVILAKPASAPATVTSQGAASGGVVFNSKMEEDKKAESQNTKSKGKRSESEISTRNLKKNRASAQTASVADEDQMQERELKGDKSKSVEDEKLQNNAIVHMNEKDYEQAIKEFDRILSDKNSIVYEEAEWNKALCLILQNKNSEARIMLGNIVRKNKKFAEAASKKLLELK